MDKIKLALSIEEAATAVSIGRTLIFEEIRNERLIARKIGRRTVILKADLDAWLKSRPNTKASQSASSDGSQS
jgi:excisionase family DNA binding protein